MRDPLEGVGDDGTIVTGAARSRVPAVFEPVLADAATVLPPGSSLYVYGSVATGQAVVPCSDVDLLAIGAAPASDVAVALSARHAAVCRGVEIAGASLDSLIGETDEPYGNRVFLRHYAVHVAGPVVPVPAAGFPADARAARGFNGDIARHAAAWRAALDNGADPAVLARRVARKTLLAVAGLVSVLDHSWTTDRETAARRWSELDAPSAAGMAMLLDWIDEPSPVDVASVADALEHTVARVVGAFERTIGRWDG